MDGSPRSERGAGIGDLTVAEATARLAGVLASPSPSGSLRRAVSVATAGWVLLTLGLRLLPWGFETNDDVTMMTVVGGLDGGRPDPVTGYQHALLGHVFVLLGRAAPAVPWYGLVLLVLLGAATVGSLVLLRIAATGLPRGAVLAVGSLLVGTVAAATVQAQFTVVAALASAAGLLGVLAIATQRRPRGGVLVALVGLAVVGSLVRFLAFALVAALALLALAMMVRSFAPGALPRVVAAFGAVLVLAVGLAATDDAVFAPDPVAAARMRAELYPPGAEFGAAQPASWQLVAEHLDPGGLSENDRELVGNWILPTPEFLRVPEPDGPMVGDSQGEALLAGLREALSDPRDVLGKTLEVLTVDVRPVAALLVLLAAVAASGRRAALLRGAVVVAATFLGLGLTDALTRLPDRVRVPVALAGALAAALVAAGAASRHGEVPAPRSERPPARVRPAAQLVAVLGGLVVLLVGARAVSEVAARADTVRTGREVVVADVAILEGIARPGDVFATWLVDLDRIHDPLALRPDAAIGVDTVRVSGWPVTLPSTRARWAELGMEDWVGAVAERDDVVLVAGPKKVELLRVHLMERRGWACPEPDGVVELESGDLAVRRFIGREACGR